MPPKNEKYPAMNVELVNPFLASLVDVLDSMAKMPLRPGKPALKKDNRAYGYISGLIDMNTAQAQGYFALSVEAALSLEIMARMVGERPAGINDEVIDMVGELTNMVTGGAKRILGEKGYEFDMAQPVMLTGFGHVIKHPAAAPRIVMPFATEWGKAFIEICIEEKKPESQPAPASPPVAMPPAGMQAAAAPA